MEHTSLDSDTALYRFHSGAPDTEAYYRAASRALRARTRALDALGTGLTLRFSLESRARRPPPITGAMHATHSRPTSVRSRRARAHRRSSCVLDADLAVDTGQVLAKERFPIASTSAGSRRWTW